MEIQGQSVESWTMQLPLVKLSRAWENQLKLCVHEFNGISAAPWLVGIINRVLAHLRCTGSKIY